MRRTMTRFLALRREKKPVDEARWRALFATEPYRRLKLRATIEQWKRTHVRSLAESDLR